MPAHDSISKTRSPFQRASGQATMEYLLVSTMLLVCLIVYPLMMKAYDAYLDSVFFILNLALP